MQVAGCLNLNFEIVLILKSGIVEDDVIPDLEKISNVLLDDLEELSLSKELQIPLALLKLDSAHLCFHLPAFQAVKDSEYESIEMPFKIGLISSSFFVELNPKCLFPC